MIGMGSSRLLISERSKWMMQNLSHALLQDPKISLRLIYGISVSSFWHRLSDLWLIEIDCDRSSELGKRDDCSADAADEVGARSQVYWKITSLRLRLIPESIDWIGVYFGKG